MLYQGENNYKHSAFFTFSSCVQTASEGECPYLQFISEYKQSCKVVRHFKEQESFLSETVLRIKIHLFILD